MTLVDSMNAALLTIGNVAVFIGALAAWDFVRRFWRTRWREFEIGRHLMRFTIGLGVVLLYVLIFQLVTLVYPREPWLDFVVRTVRTVIFVWVAWQLVTRRTLIIGDTSRLLRPDHPAEWDRSDPDLDNSPGSAPPVTKETHP
jgi:hypothetical protein